MAAIIKIPQLNPLRFYKSGTLNSFDDLKSEFEADACYVQKFVKGDFLQLQASVLTANYYPGSKWRVYDDHGNVVFSTSGIQSIVLGDSKLLLLDTDQDDIIAALDYGYYSVELEIKALVNSKITTTKYRTEYFGIVEEFPNSLLLRYSNDNNKFDVAFYPTGLPASKQYFQIRVEGGMWSEGFNPASKDTFYIDQQHDTILIDSIPFNTFKFTFGDGRGIPNWMADKINRILSLSFLEINGKQYVKADGAKFESSRDKLYPFAGWSIELIEPELSASIDDDVTAPDSVEGFGGLYNFFAGIDQREIANGAYRVPTNTELNSLSFSEVEYSNPFNIKPIGTRALDGTFDGLDDRIVLWSKTEYNSGNGYAENFIQGATPDQINDNKKAGFGLRLVRTATESETELIDGTQLSNYTGNDGKTYKTWKYGGKVWTDNLKETKFRYKVFAYELSGLVTESTTVTLTFTISGSEYAIAFDLDEASILSDIYDQFVANLDYIILNENRFVKAVYENDLLYIYQIDEAEIFNSAHFSPVSPVQIVSAETKTNLIPKVTGVEAWAALTTPAYCAFNNDDNSL